MSERKFYPDNPEFAEEMNRLYAIESKYSTLKKSIGEAPKEQRLINGIITVIAIVPLAEYLEVEK